MHSERTGSPSDDDDDDDFDDFDSPNTVPSPSAETEATSKM